MKEVRYSTKAKKDLKHYRNDLAKMKELFHVLQVLASGGDEGTGLQPGRHGVCRNPETSSPVTIASLCSAFQAHYANTYKL